MLQTMCIVYGGFFVNITKKSKTKQKFRIATLKRAADIERLQN